MAGSPGTLTGRGSGHRPAFILAGLLVSLASSLGAGERTGDVCIVERADRLVIFNKYQQRLSPDESRRFPPFVPMVIHRELDVLGDGFTPCMSVEADGELYYLLRLPGGSLSVGGEPGKPAIFRNVRLLLDTVALLRGRALRMRPAGGKEETLLQSGTRVVRLFENGQETYVRLPSPAGRFGWVTLSPSARPPEWRQESPPAQAELSPAEILLRIQPVVDGANRSLRRIYAGLSPEGSESSVPPTFRLSRSRGEIRLSLEPARLQGAFGGSLRALLSEVGRALGGTGLHAEISENTILIPLR